MTTNTPPDITDQLNKTLAQINTYIENSAEELRCGPDCQALEATKTLKEKYEAAKANVASAPGELQIAEKNYYTYIMGTSGYNDYITNKLTDQANTVKKNIQTVTNTLINEMKNLNDTYKTSYSSYTYLSKLDKKYNDEIDELEENIEKASITTGDVTTNDRKTYYEKQNYDALLEYYKISLWIFYILLIVFTIMLFVMNRGMSIVKKILFVVFFLFFPIFSTSIALWMIRIFYNFTELFPSNVYTKI
jgi:enamine deaminase RidA (YjgF/YER057c/UK114 family)